MVDTKPSAFTADSTPDDADIIPYVDLDGGGAGVHLNKKITFADLKTYVAASPYYAQREVTATQTNTTTTGASITDLAVSGVVAGTYRIQVAIVWQSTNVGTGPGFWINCSGGTVTTCVGHVYTTTTGTTATTGVADQATVAATFQMIEARAWRANNTDPGPFGGVDTANADQLAYLEAVIVVTATTTVQVMFDSETAATGVSVRVGTVLTMVQA